MNLKMTMADPAGNRTLLVESTVAAALRPQIARHLLDTVVPQAEQVGFISTPYLGGAVRLEMMGGEFCGNAARCVGLYQARKESLQEGATVMVEMSGCDHVLPVYAQLKQRRAEAQMPLPKSIAATVVAGESMVLVRFAGIVHLVHKGQPLPKAQVAAVLPALCRQQGMPAAGMIFLQGDTMVPAVYVAETDSLYWESSCASGSAAAACVLAGEKPDGNHEFVLAQPGGIIAARVVKEGGRATELSIGGCVTLEESREIRI